MVMIQDCHKLFWGIQLDTGKKYVQKVPQGFQLTMAALENNPDSKDYVQVLLHCDGSEFLLCTLQHNASLQQPLMLAFGAGEEIEFSLNGKGSVHLTGYLVQDDLDGMDEPDSDEDSEEDIPTLIETGKGGKRKADLPIKKSKKLRLIDSNDDDDDDDSEEESEEDFSDDFGDSSFGSSFLDSEAFAGSDDDDEDYEDEDGEDSDEDEEDSDEENKEDSIVKSPPKSEKKKKQVETPNVKQEKSSKSPKKDATKTPKKESKTPKQEGKTPKTDDKAKTPKQELESKTPHKKSNDLKTPNGKAPSQNGTPTPGAEGDQSTKKKKKKNKNKNKSVADSSLSESSAATPAKATPAKATPAKATPKKSTVAGGTIVEDLRVGNGPEAKAGKMVGVYYKGVLQKNNKQFDSCQNGKPFRFRLGKSEVIKGWDNGLAGMKVGGKRKITVPASQGYGNRSNGPIPANSVLVFDVELKSVS